MKIKTNSKLGFAASNKLTGRKVDIKGTLNGKQVAGRVNLNDEQQRKNIDNKVLLPLSDIWNEEDEQLEYDKVSITPANDNEFAHITSILNPAYNKSEQSLERLPSVEQSINRQIQYSYKCVLSELDGKEQQLVQYLTEKLHNQNESVETLNNLLHSVGEALREISNIRYLLKQRLEEI